MTMTMNEKGKLLVDTLKSFGVKAELTGITAGPTVTRFEVRPAIGTRVNKVTALADDIALALAAKSVRIEAPIPGKGAIGIEIPNDTVETVRLVDVLTSDSAAEAKSNIAFGLGKDNDGNYIVPDIAKMPHLLIAGQTGSGKSVCINTIITSIIVRSKPEQVRLILIDPKMVELTAYRNVPHLLGNVVTDPAEAALALKWAVREMERRYKAFAKVGAKDLRAYNRNAQDAQARLPEIVLVVDELSDLMMVAPKDVEDSICRIAQLARACGIHLVIATQRPSTDVVTGKIKANIPTRIAFSVASAIDSRTILDKGGAESLMGNGDMLFSMTGHSPIRVQGAWVSDDEIERVVKKLAKGKRTRQTVDFSEPKTRSEEPSDPMIGEAVKVVYNTGKADVYTLQKYMRITSDRAKRLLAEIKAKGLVKLA